MTELTTEFKEFNALSLRELYDVLHLRDLVFVVGQRITAVPEVDGEDPDATHALFRDADGRLIGTLRVFLGEQPVRVGRIAIHPDLQRGGFGTAMMHALHTFLGERPAIMHAQDYLRPWYGRLGWSAEGEPYLEADIPHITMRRG